MKKKMTTQRKKALLKKKLDNLLRDRILVEILMCEACDEKEATTVHHFIPKSQSLYLRWDERNLIPICAGCHTKHHRAGDPAIHATILAKRGHEWYQSLERDRHKLCKDTLANLKEIEEKLKEEG